MVNTDLWRISSPEKAGLKYKISSLSNLFGVCFFSLCLQSHVSKVPSFYFPFRSVAPVTPDQISFTW